MYPLATFIADSMLCEHVNHLLTPVRIAVANISSVEFGSVQALILTETLQSANEVFNEAREQRHQQQLHQQQQQQRKKRRYTPSAQVPAASPLTNMHLSNI